MRRDKREVWLGSGSRLRADVEAAPQGAQERGWKGDPGGKEEGVHLRPPDPAQEREQGLGGGRGDPEGGEGKQEESLREG